MRKKGNHIRGDPVCLQRYYVYLTTDFSVAIDINPYAVTQEGTQGFMK